MPATASFRVGDRVVYPNQGIGVIEHISCGMGEPPREFYQIRIEASSVRVMVPLDAVEQVGMRGLCSRAELTAIVEFLQCREACASASDWKGRYRENAEKMRSGGLAGVATVLKSLVELHTTKPLSFREKKMLDRAATLLIAEWACAAGITPEAATGRIETALAEAKLVLPALDETAE